MNDFLCRITRRISYYVKKSIKYNSIKKKKTIIFIWSWKIYFFLRPPKPYNFCLKHFFVFSIFFWDIGPLRLEFLSRILYVLYMRKKFASARTHARTHTRTGRHVSFVAILSLFYMYLVIFSWTEIFSFKLAPNYRMRHN